MNVIFLKKKERDQNICIILIFTNKDRTYVREFFSFARPYLDCKNNNNWKKNLCTNLNLRRPFHKQRNNCEFENYHLRYFIDQSRAPVDIVNKKKYNSNIISIKTKHYCLLYYNHNQASWSLDLLTIKEFVKHWSYPVKLRFSMHHYYNTEKNKIWLFGQLPHNTKWCGISGVRLQDIALSIQQNWKNRFFFCVLFRILNENQFSRITSRYG